MTRNENTKQLRRPMVFGRRAISDETWEGKNPRPVDGYIVPAYFRQSHSQPGTCRLSHPRITRLSARLAGPEVPLVTEPPEQNNSGQRRTPATRGLRLGNPQEGNSTATVGGQSRGGSLRNPAADERCSGRKAKGSQYARPVAVPLARGWEKGKQVQAHTQAERGRVWRRPNGQNEMGLNCTAG